MHKKVSTLALGIVVTLALVACSSQTDVTATTAQPTTSAAASGPTGVINIGVPLDAITFNPHASTSGPMMTYLTPLYDTLMRRVADGTVVPAVATEWKYTDDTDLHLQLTLRSDVTFWDGTPVDAAAVKANLEDARDAGGPFSSGLANLESVDVADGSVTLNFTSPVANIETVLSSPVGMLVEPSALGTEALASTPAGSGAYEVDPSTVPGTTYVYKAHADTYWNLDAYGPETLNLVVLSDTDARLNALISGQVDATVVFAAQASTAESAGVTLLSQPLNVYGIALLDRDGTMVPALKDVRVRQALNYAVDREAIVEATTFGHGDAGTQIFPSTSAGWSSSANGAYTYDPDKARALLADAGYADGFTLPVFTEARFSSYLEAVDGYLREVGVTLDIQTADSGLTAAWSSGEHAATMMAYGENDPLVTIGTWVLPTSPDNPFKTVLPGIKDLQSQLVAATTSDERKTIYQEISSVVTNQAWFLTTNTVDTIYGVNSDKIEGVEAYAGNSVPYVYGWHVKN